MTYNLITIGIIIVIISVCAIFFTYIFMKIIFPACEMLGIFIAKKLKSTYWLYIIEFSFFLTLILFLYVNTKYVSFSGTPSLLQLLYCIIFIILIIVEAAIYHKFRNENNLPITAGIIGWITSKAIWKSYIGNRMILFVEQIVHIFYLIVPLYMSMYLIAIFKWETPFYFITLLFLPIYSNIWVYTKFTLKKYYFKVSFGKYEVVFMRRLIIYTFIIIYGFYEVYKRFNQFLTESNEFNFEYLFVSSAVILYIAIDRLMKELVSDADRFKKENN